MLRYEIIKDLEPVHQYPIYDTKPQLSEALACLFTDLENSIYRKELHIFTPSKFQVRIVQKYTPADIICLLRLFGKLPSVAKEAGLCIDWLDNFSNILVDVVFVFIDAQTGEILWQHNKNTLKDPTNPSISFTKEVLKYFPMKCEQFKVK